jgi:AraC-like DNA-binding protein
VKVYTLLQADSVSRLTAAVGSIGSFIRTGDDAALLNAIHGVARATVVLDPVLVTELEPVDLAQRLEAVEAYVIVFTSLTPEGIRSALPFVRGGAAEVVLRGYDDDLTRLQHLLTGADRRTLAEQLLDALGPILAPLPPSLRDSIVAMFTEEGVDSTKRLAGAAHMTRRSVDRWLARVGIVSARLLVAAPKVLRAFTYLRNSDVSVARAASKLGFASSRPLDQHCRALLGIEAAELRTGLTTDQLVTRLVNGLRVRAGSTRE